MAVEFDWRLLLTGVGMSALITSTFGVWYKNRFDKKLENQKHMLELVKTEFNYKHNENLEKLKMNGSQINEMKKSNLEFYQSISRVSQEKKIDAIEVTWKMYIELRSDIVPLVGFYSVLLPNEYLDAYHKSINNNSKSLKLGTILNKNFVTDFDPFKELIKLQEVRPFLGELLYYKLRSAYCLIMRVGYSFKTEFAKGLPYHWNTDKLVLDHLEGFLLIVKRDFRMFWYHNPIIYKNCYRL